MKRSERATPMQCKYLWAFEIRMGQTGVPANWYNLNRSGHISKAWCIELIGLCKKFEKDPSDESTKENIIARITEHSPDFKFKGDADPKGDPEPDVKVKEIIKDKFPELNLSGDMTWDDVFDALSGAGMADPDLEVLNDLWHEREIPDIVSAAVPDDYIKPECFDKALNYLNRGSNVLFYGPAGCGKSRLGKELAKAMGLKWCMVSGTGGKRFSAVFGGDKLVVEKGKQITKWVESPLLQYIQGPNFIQLEEVFSFDPDTAVGFNGVLEKDMRCIETPKGIIEVHPDCVFFATSNVNGRSRDGNKYSGTKKQDDSLNDRFSAFKMGYSEEVEKSILDRCAKAAYKGVIRDKLEKLREQIAAANISFDASTRRLIEVVDAVNAGIKVDDAFEISFLNHLSQAERTKIGM